ncbi:PP5 [Symbiodinium necroappetens]|uniref:Serine/threonine-protein phosphatase n=1 Tax=Symbiodinium necroappetens TaxID=1628268 RepID=A0A812YQP5_9DINO|nr:PP5 [Symbiodinium necroappetens]
MPSEGTGGWWKAYRCVWSAKSACYLYHACGDPLRGGLRGAPEGAPTLPPEGGPADTLQAVPREFQSFLTGWTGEFARLVFEHCHHKYSESIPCGLLLHMARQSRELFLGEKTVQRIQTPRDGKLVIFGDTHGHLKDLLHVWLREGLPTASKTHYLFNGDICDRGDAADRGGMEAVQIWACVLSHKLAFPGAVHMNRGNHEDHHYSLHYGAKGFYGELDRRYTADEAKALKAAFKDLCDCLPLMTVVDEAMLVVHGGLPRFRQSSANAASLDEIEQIRRPLQVQTHAENRQDQIITDLLWSDPQAEPGIGPSSRGKSLINYGPDVTAEFLAAHKLSLLVRSHEVADSGCEWWHPLASQGSKGSGGKLELLSSEQKGLTVTIFSASDYCGHYDTNLGGTIVLKGSAKSFKVVSHKASDAAATLTSKVVTEKINGSVLEILSVIVQNKGQLLTEFRAVDGDSRRMLSKEEFAVCCSRVVPELQWQELCTEYSPHLLLHNGSICYTRLLAKYCLVFRSRGQDKMRTAFGNCLFGSLLRMEPSMRELQERPVDMTSEAFLTFLADSGCCISVRLLRMLYRSLACGEDMLQNFVGAFSVAFRPKHATSTEVASRLGTVCRDLLGAHPEKPLATLLLDFFQQADDKKSGFVEVQDVASLLRGLPSLKKAAENEAQLLAEYMDNSGSGKIRYVELVKCLSIETRGAAKPGQLSPEVLLDDWLEATCSMLVFEYGLGTLAGLFQQVLPPGETRCSPKVFKQVLQALPENPYGPSLSHQQLESLVVSLELDDEGLFNYQDYLSGFQIIDAERQRCKSSLFRSEVQVFAWWLALQSAAVATSSVEAAAPWSLAETREENAAVPPAMPLKQCMLEANIALQSQGHGEMFVNLTRWSVSTRPTSATPSLAAAQSRPPSASKEASESASSPMSSGAEPRNFAQKIPEMPQALSQELQIEEDYSEDTALEEAIERMRAGRSFTARSARSTRTPSPAAQAPAPAGPATADASARTTERREPCEPREAETSSGPSRNGPSTATARPQRPGSGQTRPRSAEQKLRMGPKAPQTGRGTSSCFEARSKRPRSVGGIRCEQVISRHLPEREVQSRMIAVLARQLERLRDCIPDFALQWQAVEIHLQNLEEKLQAKRREVLAWEEDTRMMQETQDQQYQLLLRGLQRKVDDARSSWLKQQRKMEDSAREEYELHKALVAKDEEAKSLKDVLKKTWEQMEDVQQMVLQNQSVLEARLQGNWSVDDPAEDPTAASERRHMDAELQRQVEVRGQLKLCNAQLEEADRAMSEQHAYAARLEEFIRKITGGGGRYVLPTALKREGQRHVAMASKMRARAEQEARRRENLEAALIESAPNPRCLRELAAEPAEERAEPADQGLTRVLITGYQAPIRRLDPFAFRKTKPKGNNVQANYDKVTSSGEDQVDRLVRAYGSLAAEIDPEDRLRLLQPRERKDSKPQSIAKGARSLEVEHGEAPSRQPPRPQPEPTSSTPSRPSAWRVRAEGQHTASKVPQAASQALQPLQPRATEEATAEDRIPPQVLGRREAAATNLDTVSEILRHIELPAPAPPPTAAPSVKPTAPPPETLESDESAVESDEATAVRLREDKFDALDAELNEQLNQSVGLALESRTLHKSVAGLPRSGSHGTPTGSKKSKAKGRSKKAAAPEATRS